MMCVTVAIASDPRCTLVRTQETKTTTIKGAKVAIGIHTDQRVIMSRTMNRRITIDLRSIEQGHLR
jgi:hypothetical protein